MKASAPCESRLPHSLLVPEEAPPVAPSEKLAAAPPRVALIVGDNQTLHCGVKDYARSLASALAEIGISADVLAPDTWSGTEYSAFHKKISREGAYDIVHVQYPSIGYRYSLHPHLLGLLSRLRSVVVTLHEYSALPRSQRLSTHLFRWSSTALLFPTEYERAQFNKVFQGLGAQQLLVPIGSNIAAAPPAASRDNTVVYFGQLRPRKGIEAFLEVARRCGELGKDYKFHVLGSIAGAHEQYAGALRTQSPQNVKWSVDLPLDQIGPILSNSFAAYLPFPDGASERRGSMLAALVNGLPVLTRKGAATTRGLQAILKFVDDPPSVIAALDDLAANPQEYTRMAVASRVYGEGRSWQEIAQQHARLYRSLLEKTSNSRLPAGVGESA